MAPFATVDDYEARYGEVEDEQRLTVLLGDASAFIAGYPGFCLREGDEIQTANLVSVTCSLVHRSTIAEAYSGITQMSQGGGGYTASATLYNPSGDFFLTKNEKRLLGIFGSRTGSVAPAIDGWYGSNLAEGSGSC